MTPRVASIALTFILSIAAVVGIQLWSLTNAPLRLADLQADPAFALRMPDADELAELGAERAAGAEGSTPMFAGHIFGTRSTSAEVYAFYERELGRLGWRLDTPPFASSTAELENRLFCNSKRSFRLAIKNKDTAFQPAFYRGRSYTTVFDATLIATDPKTSCPRPGLGPRPTAIP